MHAISIKIVNYKCFVEAAGFDRIQRVNLIIGRNNVGKSALLDLVEAVTSWDYGFEPATWRGGNPQVIFQTSILPGLVEKTFPTNASEGLIPGNHRNS